MAILNYTTQVDAYKTVTEIMKLLGSFGAGDIHIKNDNDGNPIALSFSFMVENNMVVFKLPCNYLGVFEVMKKDIKVLNKYKTKGQALRVSWRILKDWVQAQLAIIQSKLATMPEVFLPYVVLPNGSTFFEHISNTGFKSIKA